MWMEQKQKSDRTLLTVLFVYEPKLEQFFRQAVDQRLQLLTRLQEEIEKGGIKEINDTTELKEFNSSVQQLDKLNHMLAAFIKKNFELKGVAIEDLKRIKEYAAKDR